MSDFYSLDLQAQLASMETAARLALPAWNLENAGLSLIKHRENAVYRVTDADRGRFALRVHRLGYHSDAELLSELQWMRALDAAGIHTPAVVPTRDGALFQTVHLDDVEGALQLDLLAWVDGSPLGNIEGSAAVDSSSLFDIFRQIGTVAARVHNHGETWQQPAAFTRHAWDAEGLTGETPFWGRFWELKELSATQKLLMHEARDRLRAELQAFGKGPDRYGLVHADFLPENILVDGDAIRLIDFDDAGFGWHMFDLATSLFFHQGEPYFDDLVTALVAGYRGKRSLADEQLAALPMFLLARGTTYLGWLHTRRETETARELTPVLVPQICALAADYLGGDWE